jgi:hypothetical protein
MTRLEEIYKKTLYTFVSDKNRNEWEKAYSELTSIEFLENFFEENKKDLFEGYYKGSVNNVSDAVLLTRKLARSFFNSILDYCEKKNSLDSLFKNLENESGYDNSLLLLSKIKNEGKCQWLRIYGIKIDNNLYTITGGAIKLTLLMKDRNHTNNELKKLNKYKNFLSSINVISDESLCDFIENEQI